MTSKTSEKTSLEIKRFINAPRDRVYAAWTDPVQLKEWWGPKEVRTLEIIADTRVGGKYRWDLINQEGEKMSVLGEYLELVPARKVVFTWKWDDDEAWEKDRKSTRLNSSHANISYAVFCLKKKKEKNVLIVLFFEEENNERV